ncbi:hypothetical protein HY251_12585 [bacterium]|nr:hypothetical protein [bacterium]
MRKGEAKAESADEWATADWDNGRSAMDEGEAALLVEDFAKAVERFTQADYKWKQATVKAAPTAAWKRKLKVLRDAVEEVKLGAIDKGKKEHPKFLEAEDWVRTAEKRESDRYFSGAEDSLKKAGRLFEELARGR